MANNQDYKTLVKPLVFIEIYFFITIVLYAFGPHLWVNENNLLFYTVIFLYNLALIFGYIYEINRKTTCNFINKKLSPKKVIRVIQVIIFIGAIITFISTAVYTKLSSFSFQNLLDQILIAFIDPREVYEESFKDFSGGAIFKIIVFLGPISWSSIPLGIYFFNKVSFLSKISIILLIIAEALRWVMMGRNKGIIDLAIIFFVVIYFKHIRVYYLNKNLIKHSRHIYPLAIVLIVVILAYFTNTISSRLSTTFSINDYANSPLLLVCPSFLKPTLVFVTSYTTQGYHAFSKIFDLTWTPMFGVGNSMFLMSNFGEIFNTDFFQYTYQYKLYEYGIDPKSSWHSFFTWMSNDFHWTGVIFVMFLIGRLFGNTVKKCVIDGNIIAYPLLSLIIIMLIYMPGNNQILNEGVTFMTFWTIVIFMYLQRYGVFMKNRLILRDSDLI